MAGERISELEDMTIEMSKNEKQREKKLGGRVRTEYPRSMGQLQKILHTCKGNIRRKRVSNKEIIESITTENLLKLMSDTKPNIQESQRTTSSINAKEKLLQLQKISDKEKS